STLLRFRLCPAHGAARTSCRGHDAIPARFDDALRTAGLFRGRCTSVRARVPRREPLLLAWSVWSCLDRRLDSGTRIACTSANEPTRDIANRRRARAAA